MPLDPGKLSRYSRTPSPGPALYVDDVQTTDVLVERSDHKTEPKDALSFRTGLKRAFRGVEPIDTHSGAHADKRPRNVDQPPSGAIGPSSVNLRPPIDPTLGSGLPGRFEDARLYDSKSRCDSKRGAEPTVVNWSPGSTGRRLPEPFGIEMKSSSGILTNARNVVIQESTMIDHSYNVQNHTPVLQILFEKMSKGADIDSFARWPPPKCYPGTRIKLTTEIQTWLLRSARSWNFLWLSGPAAVAQTVAEFAAKQEVLGAVYFFSRPNQRYKYIEVFITLAYQLAIRFPGYQSLVTARLAAEPDLLEKAPRVQFKKLIVQPLLQLSHKRKRVVILDGLDECDGESAQLEIIELINDTLSSNTPLPIIWIVCSRPESHLKRIFARPDYAIRCWREFLHIELEESRRDTETFIRGRFKEIHDQYRECVEEDVNGCWPPEGTTEKIITKTSGLFILADTLLTHIEDSETHDPDQRLSEVVAFLESSHLTGSQSPMYNLDLFYTHILSGIPSEHWPIVSQILVALTFRTRNNKSLAVQPMCNLLGITRARFYASMQRLHSVIIIPEPSHAANTPLRFFHASFLDYLTDPSRAGRFFIGRLVSDYGITVAAGAPDFIISVLRCLGSNMGLAAMSVTSLGLRDDQDINRLLKVTLSWPPADSSAVWRSAFATVRHIFGSIFELLCILLEQYGVDDELLAVLNGFDFNAFAFAFANTDYWLDFPLKNLHKLRLSHLIRTQSASEWDRQLVSKVKEYCPRIKPVDFDNDEPRSGFFLLGAGPNSIVVVVDPRVSPSRLCFVSQKALSQVWPVLQHIYTSTFG